MTHPTLCAARRGDERTLQAAVRADGGAACNVRDDSNWTPLHLAAAAGWEGCAAMLIAAGADVAAEGDLGRTPLHCAATDGHTGCIELLLRSGAPADARDAAGWSPLHLAARAGDVLSARLLLAAGADGSAHARAAWRGYAEGATPLEVATGDAVRRCIQEWLAAERLEEGQERPPLPDVAARREIALGAVALAAREEAAAHRIDWGNSEQVSATLIRIATPLLLLLMGIAVYVAWVDPDSVRSVFASDSLPRQMGPVPLVVLTGAVAWALGVLLAGASVAIVAPLLAFFFRVARRVLDSSCVPLLCAIGTVLSVAWLAWELRPQTAGIETK